MIARLLRGAIVTIAAACLGAGAVRAQGAVADAPPPASVRASLAPPYAELGQQVVYRGSIVGSYGSKVRWLAPEPDERFTWGAMSVFTRKRGWKTHEPVPADGRYDVMDTVFVEIPLQAFQPGRQSIPGLRFELDDGSGRVTYRLPMTTLTVVPIIAANDTTADFRGVHGPLAAPWWERVPWTWVIAGLLLIAAAIALIRWWRSRKRRPAAAPAAPIALDPLAEALAALGELRALHLPEHGRFAEHAFRLGQILRRYLESVTRVTRPGDTTPELVRHLQQAGLDAEDQTRLAGLLRVWDRVKFAREPFTAEEALKAETAVESFLRRPPAAAQRVA